MYFVLTELASFMKQTANTVDVVFKLTESAKMYQNRMTELRGQPAERIHTTRLKNKLLSNFEVLTEFKGATKSYRKIMFASAIKIGENTTNISNCYFSS